LRLVPGYIPHEFIDDLRDRVDIVEIVKNYVLLKKQGQNYIGLCPFHSEKTSSFVVSPHKQIFHCFGCGKGGNVFTFLMEKEVFTFPEAVSHLANYCGIPIPYEDKSPEKAKRDALRERFYHINKLAADFFQKTLYKASGQKAIRYLQGRGLNEHICEKFLLGSAPDSWDKLSSYLLNEGVREDEILTLGLAVKSQKGNLVDRFRNRLIFPIMDDRGRIIGFGGRVLDDSQPKYLNSPETPLFNKGRQLYGLNLAKGSIRSSERAILMEGYMDVIAAHEYGITEAVGTLGTALTAEQGKLLMRYTYNAVICFDADAAGQEATMRGLDVLQQLGIKVGVMIMPEGKDPDEVLRKRGQNYFTELIHQACSLFEYKYLKLVEKHNKDSMSGKIEIIQELLPDMYKVQSPVERQGFIQMLAERLSFSEQAIHAEIKKFQTGQVKGEKSEKKLQLSKDKIITAVEKAQSILIRFILEIPEIMLEVEENGGKDLFCGNLYKEIYQTNYLLRQAGHNIKAEDLITYLENGEARQLVTEILLEDSNFHDWERIYKDCLITLEIELLNKKLAEQNSLMTQYEKSGNVTKSLELMAEVQTTIKERQRLVSTLTKGGSTLEN
jgi:DNA primase